MRTIIPGPPGTGKTHTLIHKYLTHELIDLKTDSKKIAYISFSTAAAKEARKRIEDAYHNLNLNTFQPCMPWVNAL